jgi:protein-S-isoprenylcysteine O-methyltransferase Ste14
MSGAGHRAGTWRNSKTWDVIAGLPLVLLCAFGIAGVAIQLHRQWPAAHDAMTWAPIAAQFGGGLFLAMQLVLTLMRRLPLAKLPGVAPRLWALVGANSSYLLLLLPRETVKPAIAIFSAALTLLGTLGSVLVLVWLGRGFAILPQARKLVTRGPYRLVRHPLYFCEQIALFGVSFQFLQPEAFLIVLVGLALQFPRMRYEEQILENVFPDYAEYAAGTAMIVPGWIRRKRETPGH